MSNKHQHQTPEGAGGAVATKAPSAALTRAQKGAMAINPIVNAAAVVEVFQGNVLGPDADMHVMTDELHRITSRVRKGDLHSLEAMLVSQAVALESMFASLARRAQGQTCLRSMEAFMGLALKSQAQSRATISAIVDLKHPRQATFVKQANIAQGPQQVNNAVDAVPSRAHGEKLPTPPNKLLEQSHGQCSSGLDAGASRASERGRQAVEAVGAIHRPQEPRG